MTQQRSSCDLFPFALLCDMDREAPVDELAASPLDEEASRDRGRSSLSLSLLLVGWSSDCGVGFGKERGKGGGGGLGLLRLCAPCA